MKTLVLAPAARDIASSAFVLLGCSDNSNALVTPSDQTLATASSPSSLAKGGAVVGSAVGGGSIVTPGGDVTMFSSVKFGFTALMYKDGTCGGQVEMDLVGMDASLVKKIHGTVMGAKFEGNVAMFWAELRTEFVVDLVGPATWRQIFVVTDNGEGENSVPDRMSNPWLTSEDLAPEEFDTYWAMSPSAFLGTIPVDIGTPAEYPLERGNIQVRVK